MPYLNIPDRLGIRLDTGLFVKLLFSCTMVLLRHPYAREKNIRKNLEYSDILYEIASDETAKKKLIQVALKTMFRLRKDVPDKNLTVKIATIDELKKSSFKEWFEVGNG